MRKGVQGPLARSENTPPPGLVYNPPVDGELPVLYSDDEILMLSKPAGLLSVPGNKPELQDCMEARAQAHFPCARTVHRLDRGTSGIFVMPLNPRSHRIIGLQFEKRKISKTYIALVSGEPSDNTGVIELPLRTDWYNRPKQMVDPCLGREAVTHWQVLKRYDGMTRLKLNPVTGRSHQLRVHMQAIGHPIMGDEFYAPPNIADARDRLMLHAERLRMRHPGTGKDVQFHDPCPF